MTDAELHSLLMDYTREAAESKTAVGESIMAQIGAEARPNVIRPARFRPRHLVNAVILLALALTVFMQTPVGQAFASYVYENLIQRFFKPEEVNMQLEGMDNLDTLYPYGEIVESDDEGYASYVIYIDDTYDIEQQDNLLIAFFEYKPHIMTPEEEAETRARYADDLGMSQEEIDEEIEQLKEAYMEPPGLPPVFMEITQVANITVENMAAQLMDKGIYKLYSGITGDSGSALLGYSEGVAHDSIIIDIHILDNTCGGVFVITVQYFFEATEGHGSRLGYAVNTLEIIDIDELEK